MEDNPALKDALRLLSMRARTRHELQQALARRQHPPSIVAAALERVQTLGYLDDAKYARGRAELLLREGKMGPGAVARHLKGRGLSEDLVRSALHDAQRELDFDPHAAARSLLLRRGLLHEDREPTDRERGKAARVLAARGFPSSVAERLLGTALDSPPEDD